MKNFLKFVSVITLAFMLTACYPTGERSAESGDVDSVWAEAAKIENLDLKLALPQDCPSELPEVTAAVKRWDGETVLEALCGGKTVVSRKEYQSDFYPDESRVVFMFDDGAYMFFEPSRIGYDGLGADEYYYKFFFGKYETYYNARDIVYSSELEGFDKADALKRVTDITDKLDIKNLGEPIIFGITMESANSFFLGEKNEREAYNDGEFEYSEWTKDDEAYYITFPLEYNEIPVEINEVSVPGHSSTGSFVKAVVTKNGVLYFECEGITDAGYKNGENIKLGYGATDILSRIVSEYSQKVLTGKVEYYNCELTYAPVDKPSENEWTLAPVWRFDYAASFSSVDISGRKHDFYSAETGNRIAYEWQN